MDTGRHLLLPVIDAFVVQQPYTLSVISQFSLKIWCRLSFGLETKTVKLYDLSLPTNIF